MHETSSDHTDRLRLRSAARSLIDFMLMRTRAPGGRTIVVRDGIAPPPVVTAAEITDLADLTQGLAGANEYFASLNDPKPDRALGL